MDNEKPTEEPQSAAAVEESQSSNKRSASSEAGEEPPAKRINTSSQAEMESSNPVKGGPPLMPMDFDKPAKSLQNPEVEEKQNATKKLAPPAAPAPAPVPPRSETAAERKAASPSVDPPKSSSPSTPPLQPKTSSRSRKGTSDVKSFKGLRHFSMMVCKKVEEKGETTYNEVADELVKQVMEVRRKEEPNGKFDEKNIRRRVYDSINVLLAMDIIAKEKKQITWKGLPSTAQHDIQLLEREEEARKEQVQAKRRVLQEILLQQICFRNLVTHNKQREAETIHAEKVPLPFIVVNTQKDAIIHCNMAPDLTNVMFEYDRPFEINDDNSILTRLGM